MEKEFKISLAAARVNAGLTQLDVAHELHINKQTVVNWEKGKTKIGFAQFEMLCRLYEVPRDYIFLPQS